MTHLNKISILAVLFLSCREDNVSHLWLMIFSDAQPIQFWSLECNTYNQQQSEGVHHKCFCQPWQCDDEIKIQFTNTVEDDFELSVRDEAASEILTLPFDVIELSDRFVYSLSLTPSEISPEICNQLIQFVVKNAVEDLYQSDCQDIRDDQPNTILANYSNHRNVFGLVYSVSSPEPTFNLRIPAIFFHQRFPKEEEVMQLSNSLISQNSVVRKQRLLDIDYVPYYFHEKLNLILQHQFVTIFNREWVTQEAYEIPEGDRRWPAKKGKIYLTEKDFVMRNVL